ncbi:uncharacterized protein PV06_02591 [Exophiala oligosperma]|uniref:UBC core domain-containing protein n=1 Tax=Exophiala oligosperma TaxID=215243 RepID=A0A0D2EGC8_9EURO|nr:uncharacterized protein PV06_02591 [Exophiala oligosperma]KIW46974.1 hypothetical protein PV06_02591 [Exophiala oligosperma]
MSTPLLPSFRRQQLVLDFSILKDNCPEGVYLSLVPGNPSLWAAVLFVRDGPYAGAVLRFDITFQDSYPAEPPRIVFSSDIFHPLVVPQTTYTFSASVVDSTTNTISASDNNRLRPGEFWLRYGFPYWFPQWNVASEEVVHDNDVMVKQQASGPGSETDTVDEPVGQPSGDEEIHDRKGLLLKLISHIKSAFEDADMLDKMPLEFAGDPSAWHAWRAHRGLSRKEVRSKCPTVANDGSPSSPKNPGEWKWDGVWESRVNNGIEASINEVTLFGSAAGGRAGRGGSVDLTTLDMRQKAAASAHRQIRFSKLDDDHYLEVMRAISKSTTATPT